MKEQNTHVTYTRSELDALPDETDWERVDALTDEDIEEAALSDPDDPPTDADFWKDATVVMPENMEEPTDLQNYYLDELSKIINEIVNISAGGNYIYRGEPKCYEKISSSLYRRYESVLASGQFTIERIQDFEIQRARDYIRNEDKEPFEIASELQHYGGTSNLIDFTTDYHIALYFACAKLDGEDGHDEDGRIILLQQNKETIAKYLIRKAQYPQNRTQAQNSIFVKPPKGFIFPNDKDVKTVCIPKELKQWILIHLSRFQDISYQTLFNDIYGFLRQSALSTSKEALQNLVMQQMFAERVPTENLTDAERQERHKKMVEAHITRIEYSPYNATYYEELARYYCFEMCEYDCAIETFSKAILLNSNYTVAYANRGTAYAQKEDWDHAIEDLVKATQLGPPSSYTYGLLGWIYDRRGNRLLADEHFQEALELDPNNSAIHEYLQQRERRDISMLQQLSKKVDYLINQAAADPERKVEHFDLEQGIIISTNGEDIIQEDLHRRNIPQDQRETVEAEWESARRELVSAGYLEQSGGQQPLTLFRVTEAGYQYASQSNSPS